MAKRIVHLTRQYFGENVCRQLGGHQTKVLQVVTCAKCIQRDKEDAEFERGVDEGFMQRADQA